RRPRGYTTPLRRGRAACHGPAARSWVERAHHSSSARTRRMSRAGETFVGRVGSPFLFGEDASHVTGGRNVRRASVLTIPLRRGRLRMSRAGETFERRT